MRVPVLIAAYNEPDIGDTLRRLPKDLVDVIVAVNGRDTKSTAVRARTYGVTVLEYQEPGKLPALQATLRKLPELGHDPLAPLLFLDADAYPLLPRAWVRSMTRLVAGDRPASAAGLVTFFGPGRLDNSLRTVKKLADAARARARGVNIGFGSNMALGMSRPDRLEAVLAMPHVWRGEDRMMMDLVAGEDGRYTQAVAPGSLVAMSSRYATSLRDRLRLGAAETARRHDESYNLRAAPDAEYFYDSANRRLVPIERPPA